MDLIIVVASLILPLLVLWSPTVKMFKIDSPPTLLLSFFTFWGLLVNVGIELYSLNKYSDWFRTEHGAFCIILGSVIYWALLKKWRF